METLLWFLKTYADHFLRTSKLSFIKQTLPLQYTITIKHWDHRPDHPLSLHFSLEALVIRENQVSKCSAF